MKKIKLLIILLIIIIPLNVNAQKDTVKFSSCIDGDTANFILNKKEVKVRFLAVDTPETKHPTKGEEPYGKEASKYTCKRLKEASKIELEYDDNSDKKDKYNRYLAWVFVDDSLLQAELIKNGLAEVAYLYGDYKYTPLLQDYEENAKVQKVGMYSGEKSYYENHKNDKKKTNTKNKTIKKILKKIINEILDEIFK